MSWDTFGLFGALLDTFAEALAEAGNTATALAPAKGTHLARIGFSRYAPPDRWSEEHEAFIASRLDGELSQQGLAWYEAAADAVSAFACYSLGVLLGEQAAGQLDEVGWTLGEAHRPAFLLIENDRISALYAGYRRKRRVDAVRSGFIGGQARAIWRSGVKEAVGRRVPLIGMARQVLFYGSRPTVLRAVGPEWRPGGLS